MNPTNESEIYEKYSTSLGLHFTRLILAAHKGDLILSHDNNSKFVATVLIPTIFENRGEET